MICLLSSNKNFYTKFYLQYYKTNIAILNELYQLGEQFDLVKPKQKKKMFLKSLYFTVYHQE